MCTSGHILKLQITIKKNKTNKKTTYITFLDVTKAYDKAWLDGIMHIMYKEGCKGGIWNITDKLNQNLKATVRTAIGNTRNIRINNCIRQGGVQYAILMDEINKELQKVKNNTKDIDQNTTCLLWVDDVALIVNNLKDQKKLLKITDEVANKYRIKFGEAKTKTLQINSKQPNPYLEVNNFQIETADKYNYLGITQHQEQYKSPH